MAQGNIAFSQSIANLDGLAALTYTTVALAVQNVNPVVQNTSGEGNGAMLLNVSDIVTVASGDEVTTTDSTYSFVRVPTSAHVKRVKFCSTGIASAGAADFNVRFSDSQNDGTSQALQGTVPQISAANNKLFGAAHSILAADCPVTAPVDLTYANLTNFPLGSENKPLWSVLGYTTDPGGAFDIVAYLTTAVTTGGTALLSVDYVVPGAA